MLRRRPSLAAIPQIPPGIPGRDVLEAVKQILETREGRRGSDNLDRVVTYRDLVLLGLIAEGNVPKRGTEASPVSSESAGGGMPVGTVFWVASDTPPEGSIKANGAAVSRTAYADLFEKIGTTFGAGDGTTTFNVPDLRGEFVRGWDDGRGIDSGRVFGSAQSDQNKAHSHTGSADSNGNHRHVEGIWHTAFGGVMRNGVGASGGTSTTDAGYSTTDRSAGITDYAGTHSHSLSINSDGGAEARPRNVALLACIKY